MTIMNEIIPDEVIQDAQNKILQIFLKYGLSPIITVIIIVILFVFLSPKFLEQALEKGIESYKSDLAKESFKNLEVWKTRKDLMFELVEFLDQRIFFNPTLGKEKRKKSETQDILLELNHIYGKLYLVLDTDIILKINNLMTGGVSEIQRYYIYRELRGQLLKFLLGKEPEDSDYPYVSRPVHKVTWDNVKLKNINEMKKNLPFVEEGDSPDTFKGLPNFGLPEN